MEQRACRDAGVVLDDGEKAVGASGGQPENADTKPKGKRKERRKRSGRARVIHTAESLHKLYHKPPETVYKTICHDEEIQVRCKDGVVRPGNKVTVADCTPDEKCDMCARMKTVAASHGPGKAARAARRLKLSEMFDRHTRVYNAVSLYTGTGHDVTMYTLLKYPMG